MMTLLSGFLLLLCVGYSHQQFVPLRDAAGRIIPYALRGVYTKPLEVDGVEDTRYRNFTNLLFFKYSLILRRWAVPDVYTCHALCLHTKGCAKFHFVTGVDYPYGCNLFTKCAEAIISPLYSGDTICDVTTNIRGCTKREVSYEGDYRIQILKESRPKYPFRGTGVSGCQKRCKKFSGQNGFDLKDIDWKRSNDSIIKGAAKNGKVSCKYFTYYRADVISGFCLLFVEGAVPTKVEKIGGPATKYEDERLKNITNAIHSPDFHDFKGAVFPKEFSVGYEESIVFPDQCKEACKNKQGCHSFISVIGMPYNSGCYMFKKGATQRPIYITTGMGNCSAADCRADDYTYGRTYEIILREEYGFKGSSLYDCQNFCKNHNGYNQGFPWHQIWWGKTGAALEPLKHFYRCSYFTYISKDSFGEKQCILYNGEPKRQQIIMRGDSI